MPYLSSGLVQGFPPPKNFIPGLEAAGLDVDFVNLYEVAQKYKGNEIRKGLELARSDKIILSYWDYIYHRDLDAIFSDKKKKIIFQVNWNEEPKTIDQKIQILRNSKYVTLSQDYFRNQWIQELGQGGKKYHDKMKVWRFPCTRGAILNKEACRERIGQSSRFSVIVWGYYGSGKGHVKLLNWILPLSGTSLLFCGTPASPEAGEELRMKAFRMGIDSRVFFSKPLISDTEADIWFSAADIGVVTYFKKIGESSLAYMIGHEKCVITSNIKCFPEYKNKFNAVVNSSEEKFPETIVQYVVNAEKRKKQEEYARAYARKFNWMTSGLQFREMVESI